MEFKPLMKGLWHLLLSVIVLVSAGGFPLVPHARDFELVWSDEFDGDALDASKWKGHYTSAEATVRRGSYWSTEMAVVKDGKLHIRTEYLPEGLNGNGKPGWYTCGVDTNGLYGQTFGYFEVRCILPKGSGMWSAFWMLSDGMGQVGNGGEDGAEIDVFESPFFGEGFNRRVSSNIHIDGYGADLKSSHVCEPYLLLNDPYERFNTYGVEWNEEEYIFYVNGIETGRSSFGGTAKTPEYLILSVEIGGADGRPGDSWAGKALSTDDAPTDFVIDYVRAYQYRPGAANGGRVC